MIKILFIFLVLFPLSTFASILPAFPMTIYGTLKVGNNDLGVGAMVSFVDGSGNTIGSYTSNRAGWYGYDNSFSGTSPTFSSFIGKLGVSVQHGGKIYSITSITGSTQACPASNNIVFISNVCRYDILLSAPVILASPGGGGGGGGSISSVISTTVTPVNVQNQTGSMVSTGTISPLADIINPIIAFTGTGRELQIVSKDIKIKKPVIVDTQLKKGTQVIVYRRLSSGRTIRFTTVRVLPNGKIRFTPKFIGNYILGLK